MATDLMKLVQSVLAQKRALDAKERDLIASLNRVLPDMGYRVVSTGGEARGSRGRRRSAGASGRPTSAAPKNLVCGQCGRRFSHPLHLGRHTAATHKSTSAAGSRGKTAKTSARRRRPMRRRRAEKAARKTG